jgi:hypothetical protein
MKTKAYRLERDGVEVQEVSGEDAVGLGLQELAPGRAGALRGRVDAGVLQDLPDRGRGDRVAQARELDLDPAVAPAAVLSGQPQDQLPDGGRRAGSARTATRGERPLPGDELAVPGQQRGGGDRKDLAPALPRDQPGQDRQPDPVGGLVADPGDLTAQHRVFMAQCQHFRVLGHAAAQHRSRHRDQIPDQRGDNRHRHPQIVPE